MNKIIIGFILAVTIAAGIFYLKQQNKPQTDLLMLKESPTSNKDTKALPANVPLPAREDIIRSFFELINKKRVPEAMSMMDDTINKNDSLKQQWEVAFNNWQSVQLRNIEPYNFNWTNTHEIYKVEFSLTLDPKNPGMWENGNNIRFIEINKQDNLWKIMGIATGP